MLALTKMMPAATKFHEMMRRCSLPAAIAAGSAVKMRISPEGTRWQSVKKSAIISVARSAPSRNVCFTRLACPAPKFWPAMGATDMPRATTGMKPACISRMPIPNPACAAEANVFVTE